MNKISINGRLIKDPKLRVFKNNVSLCTFFLANDYFRGNSRKTSFIKCNAWGKQGIVIAKNAKAGTELTVIGRLNQRKFEDKVGNVTNDVSVIVEQFAFDEKLLIKPHYILKAAS